MFFSIALHAFLLFGIALVLPDPRSAANFLEPLQVVLVNSKSKSKPVKADALAQHNLDDGGNTAEERRAKSPLPTIRDDLKVHPGTARQARRPTGGGNETDAYQTQEQLRNRTTGTQEAEERQRQQRRRTGTKSPGDGASRSADQQELG